MDKKITSLEIKKFIEVFKRLNDYEGQQRLIRGHGCFSEDEIPIQEVQRVLQWLQVCIDAGY